MKLDPDDAVRIGDLSVSYGNSRILERVDAVVPKGGSTMLIGPNGAGKTTLLLAILGEVPFTGEIAFAGGRRGAKPVIGYVPQNLDMDRGLPLTVLEFISLGLQKRPLWLGLQARAKSRARELLGRVGAEHLADSRLGVLSGGELQRVLLALALEREPDLLILDEPTAGVDLRGDQIFCEMLEDLRAAHGFTQLMVSHDLGMVAYHATHVIALKTTVVAAGAPCEVFTNDVLTRLFGIHMGALAWPAQGTVHV